MQTKHEKRAKVLARFYIKKKNGLKMEKINGRTTGKLIPMNENDKKRLDKEIAHLEFLQSNKKKKKEESLNFLV